MGNPIKNINKQVDNEFSSKIVKNFMDKDFSDVKEENYKMKR